MNVEEEQRRESLILRGSADVLLVGEVREERFDLGRAELARMMRSVEYAEPMNPGAVSFCRSRTVATRADRFPAAIEETGRFAVWRRAAVLHAFHSHTLRSMTESRYYPRDNDARPPVAPLCDCAASNRRPHTRVRGSRRNRPYKAGLTLRDQAEVVLRGVAGKDAATLTEIARAVGTASTPENLAIGLTQLASIGKRFLGHKKDVVATRAKVMRLDEPYLNRMTDAAAPIRATRLDASGRSAGKKVTQGALDKKDGEAFHLLEAILSAFEKAHDIDPTLPRLVPISMRRHFGKHARPQGARDPDRGRAAGRLSAPRRQSMVPPSKLTRPFTVSFFPARIKVTVTGASLLLSTSGAISSA